ncbi:hypothetical protein Pyn_05791 [Prunus yedoensis var. nudiflora]|uniref:Uncharacterized protein n=1 Tax=Prunus yedoensis var. nudiflora TaxID=2094558 RepID=A0A314ZL18_PRUYE|nr:hypothetical protein Pyn_05791 [Prunus yedoensis var. nudiflora]
MNFASFFKPVSPTITHVRLHHDLLVPRYFSVEGGSSSRGKLRKLMFHVFTLRRRGHGFSDGQTKPSSKHLIFFITTPSSSSHSPVNLTQIPSTSASRSNPSNPLLGLNRNPLLPVQNQAPQRDQLALNNPNQAGPSSSSVIRPQRPHQEQGVRINNDGQVPEQNSPPVIHYMYMRRRRRGNAHQWAFGNQPAQDVIDVGSDFEEGSSDGEDIDLD